MSTEQQFQQITVESIPQSQKKEEDILFDNFNKLIKVTFDGIPQNINKDIIQNNQNPYTSQTNNYITLHSTRAQQQTYKPPVIRDLDPDFNNLRSIKKYQQKLQNQKEFQTETNNNNKIQQNPIDINKIKQYTTIAQKPYNQSIKYQTKNTTPNNNITFNKNNVNQQKQQTFEQKKQDLIKKIDSLKRPSKSNSLQLDMTQEDTGLNIMGIEQKIQKLLDQKTVKNSNIPHNNNNNKNTQTKTKEIKQNNSKTDQDLKIQKISSNKSQQDPEKKPVSCRNQKKFEEYLNDESLDITQKLQKPDISDKDMHYMQYIRKRAQTQQSNYNYNQNNNSQRNCTISQQQDTRGVRSVTQSNNINKQKNINDSHNTSQNINDSFDQNTQLRNYYYGNNINATKTVKISLQNQNQSQNQNPKQIQKPYKNQRSVSTYQDNNNKSFDINNSNNKHNKSQNHNTSINKIPKTYGQIVKNQKVKTDNSIDTTSPYIQYQKPKTQQKSYKFLSNLQNYSSKNNQKREQRSKTTINTTMNPNNNNNNNSNSNNTSSNNIKNKNSFYNNNYKNTNKNNKARSKISNLLKTQTTDSDFSGQKTLEIFKEQNINLVQQSHNQNHSFQNYFSVKSQNNNNKNNKKDLFTLNKENYMENQTRNFQELKKKIEQISTQNKKNRHQKNINEINLNFDNINFNNSNNAINTSKNNISNNYAKNVSNNNYNNYLNNSKTINTNNIRKALQDKTNAISNNYYQRNKNY